MLDKKSKNKIKKNINEKIKKDLKEEKKFENSFDEAITTINKSVQKTTGEDKIRNEENNQAYYLMYDFYKKIEDTIGDIIKNVTKDKRKSFIEDEFLLSISQEYHIFNELLVPFIDRNGKVYLCFWLNDKDTIQSSFGLNNEEIESFPINKKFYLIDIYEHKEIFKKIFNKIGDEYCDSVKENVEIINKKIKKISKRGFYITGIKKCLGIMGLYEDKNLLDNNLFDKIIVSGLSINSLSKLFATKEYKSYNLFKKEVFKKYFLQKSFEEKFSFLLEQLFYNYTKIVNDFLTLLVKRKVSYNYSKKSLKETIYELSGVNYYTKGEWNKNNRDEKIIEIFKLNQLLKYYFKYNRKKSEVTIYKNRNQDIIFLKTFTCRKNSSFDTLINIIVNDLLENEIMKWATNIEIELINL